MIAGKVGETSEAKDVQFPLPVELCLFCWELQMDTVAVL